jgi:hypothetical protein
MSTNSTFIIYSLSVLIINTSIIDDWAGNVKRSFANKAKKRGYFYPPKG